MKLISVAINLAFLFFTWKWPAHHNDRPFLVQWAVGIPGLRAGVMAAVAVIVRQVTLGQNMMLLDKSESTGDSAAAARSISVGVSSKSSHKEEDTHAFYTTDHSLSGFAVFDGHGGGGCSMGCASPENGMLVRLLKGKDTMPTDQKIEEMFWQMDAELGQSLAAIGGHGREKGGAHAGATACVLLVESLKRVTRWSSSSQRNSPPDAESDSSNCRGMACVLAWVGDSTAVTVDMTKETNPLIWASENHSASSNSEQTRLTQLHAVAKALGKPYDSKSARKEKKQVRKGAAYTSAEMTSSTSPEKASSPEILESKISISCGNSLPPSDEGEDASEARIKPPSKADISAAIKREGIILSDGITVDLCARAFEREALINTTIPKGGKYRRNAFVMQRPEKKDANRPWVVATCEDPYSSHYRDLQMTRRHSNLRTAHCACTTSGSPTECFHACDELVEICRVEYIQARGLDKMGDDTTVMVVDLNPSNLVFEPVPNGCCTLL
ncbi:hypothetical protein AB1Y20_003119 [Prymnesium parvum]|uniref:PPM-type phosphatase domain-containing protein n=1 Tax=Prymnesium parvum TaxID=97485 RepID=A0AB34JDM7_PRYPA